MLSQSIVIFEYLYYYSVCFTDIKYTYTFIMLLVKVFCLLLKNCECVRENF